MDVNDAAHAIFTAVKYVRLSPAGVPCCKCGKELKIYYCESRLYAVVCDHCYTVTLAKGGSPAEAAEKVGGKT